MTPTPAEPDLDRLRAARRAQLDLVCTRAEPFSFGTAYFTPEHPVKWELNLLLVDDAAGLSAPALMEEADRVQGGAGLTHRRIEAAAEGAHLRQGFAQAGWLAEELLLMVLRPGSDGRDDPAPVTVREAPFDAIRPLAERWHGDGMDAEVARAVIDADEAVLRRTGGCILLAERDGAPAGYATLGHREDGLTEIEQVYTAPEHRGHGLASALVRAAAAAGRDRGDDVYLLADAGDWPRKLYERLGFATVGMRHGFTRPGPGQA